MSITNNRIGGTISQVLNVNVDSVINTNEDITNPSTSLSGFSLPMTTPGIATGNIMVTNGTNVLEWTELKTINGVSILGTGNLTISGGGGGGGVSGSGTVNRLTKWTPNGTTLGTSGIAENSTGQLAIDFPTSTNVKLFIRSFTEHDGLSVNTTASDQGSRAIYGSSTGISSSSTNHGVWGDASRNTNNNVGVFGMAAADTGSAPLGIGGEFKASAGSQSVPCAPGAIAIGISAYAYTNGGSAYFARFIKDVAISPNFKDRVVLSDNNYGYADWGKVTSSYTTGETGTFTSADGKTITVTNGLITSIV